MLCGMSCLHQAEGTQSTGRTGSDLRIAFFLLFTKTGGEQSMERSPARAYGDKEEGSYCNGTCALMDSFA